MRERALDQGDSATHTIGLASLDLTGGGRLAIDAWTRPTEITRS